MLTDAQFEAHLRAATLAGKVAPRACLSRPIPAALVGGTGRARLGSAGGFACNLNAAEHSRSRIGPRCAASASRSSRFRCSGCACRSPRQSPESDTTEVHLLHACGGATTIRIAEHNHEPDVLVTTVGCYCYAMAGSSAARRLPQRPRTPRSSLRKCMHRMLAQYWRLRLAARARKSAAASAGTCSAPHWPMRTPAAHSTSTLVHRCVALVECWNSKSSWQIAAADARPGDMIHFFKCQFRVTQGAAAALRSVGTPNHVAVIAAVPSAGVFDVLEQNVGGATTVRKGAPQQQQRSSITARRPVRNGVHAGRTRVLLARSCGVERRRRI